MVNQRQMGLVTVKRSGVLALVLAIPQICLFRVLSRQDVIIFWNQIRNCYWKNNRNILDDSKLDYGLSGALCFVQMNADGGRPKH